MKVGIWLWADGKAFAWSIQILCQWGCASLTECKYPRCTFRVCMPSAHQFSCWTNAHLGMLLYGELNILPYLCLLYILPGYSEAVTPCLWFCAIARSRRDSSGSIYTLHQCWYDYVYTIPVGMCQLPTPIELWQIYTHIHTYIPTYIHTYLHTYIHTYIHTYKDTYKCKLTTHTYVNDALW